MVVVVVVVVVVGGVGIGGENDGMERGEGKKCFIN